MTPEQRAELRRLCEAASPAPWCYDSYSTITSVPLSKALTAEMMQMDVAYSVEDLGEGRDKWLKLEPTICWVPVITGDTAVGRQASDADFIEASRTALPALLDYVEKLEGEIERLKKEKA